MANRGVVYFLILPCVELVSHLPVLFISLLVIFYFPLALTPGRQHCHC